MDKVRGRFESHAVPGETIRPFVLIVSGQSNVGFDNGGQKIVEPNILISNHLTDPTGFSPARFGVAPLNLGVLNARPPLAWVTSEEDAFNNIGVQFANTLRAANHLASDRPIVIIPNWFPGQSITEWVGAGGESRLWRCLKRHLDLLSRSYPGCLIDHVIWAQGEADGNASKFGYSTTAAYKAGFVTLLDQFRGLPQWAACHTSVSVQELPRWDASRKFAARNDVIETLGNGEFDRVATVSSDGLEESRQTLSPHFDSASIFKLADRHFDAWRCEQLPLSQARVSARS